MIFFGIDCGARNTKILALKEDRIAFKEKRPTGFDQRDTVYKLLEDIRKGTSEEVMIGVTGCGKDLFEYVKINDLIALAKGTFYLFPCAEAVADIGAEESKVIKMDKKGNIVDFAVNDRCAAGTGTFLEAMAAALELDIEEFGKLALKAKKRISLNSQCVIFAETEVVSLIHSKVSREDISKAICDSLAERISAMIRRMRIKGKVVLSGGVIRNIGFVESMKEKLEELIIPEDPEFIPALGVALILKEKR